MRLFAAIRPPQPVLDHLEAALEVISAEPATRVGGHRDSVRWTARENWHVTVAFYGEVPDGATGELTDRLDALAAHVEPFDLALRGSGVFAGRTLWIGLGGATSQAVALAAGAAELGAEITGRRDQRVRSRLHLTFARVTDRGRRAGPVRGRARDGAAPGAADHLVRALSVYSGPSWRVDELLLVSSHPGEGRSGGPRYVDVATLRLGGGG